MEEQRQKRFKRKRNEANLNQFMAGVSPQITQIANRVDGRKINFTCDAVTANEASSNREKRGVVEPWRENTYKRVMTMRTKYMPTVQGLRYMLTAMLKTLCLQGNNSDQRKIEKLKHTYKNLGGLLSVLNISKDKLVPVQEERVDEWDISIASYLRKVIKPKNTSTSLEKDTQKTISSAPLRPPLVIPPGISPSFLLQEYNNFENILITQTPMHEECVDDWDKSIGSHWIEVFTGINTSTSLGKDTHETILGAPSLPTYNDLEKEPSFPLLVIPPGILPPSLLEEYNDFIVIPPGISPSSLFEEYNNLEVIPPGVSPSSLLKEHNNLENSLITQTPIQRLINAVSASSHHALKSAVDDIHSVMRLVDGLEGSGPRPGSGSSLGWDLKGTSSRIGETRRYITSVPTENPRIEAHSYFNQFLREEIEEVNQKLIDTRVNICEKKDVNLDSSGIEIKCVFIAVSVNANLKYLILRSRNSLDILVEPLHLLVPTDYPKSSPILLFPGEVGDDISSKVTSKLARYLRGYENPIMVSEIARTWDVCAREVIIEFAEKYGGGTFSSRYGRWENC